MKRFGLWLPVFAGVVVGATGAAAVGCAGDSEPARVLDGGDTDVTVETGIDGQVTSEASADVLLDRGPGDADASTMGDVDATTMGDVDASATIDADANSTGDADAAGQGTDAATDGSLAAALAFPGQVAAALCDRNAVCCGTTGDAATFDWARCVRTYLALGYAGSNVGTQLINGGNVTLDPALARLCLNGIAAQDCVTDEITQAQSSQLFQSCFGALYGNLPVGSPCRDAIECASGSFCAPTDSGVGDGGATGLCEPLRSNGQPCGDFGRNPAQAETACSYRGSANTNLYCLFATPSPVTVLDPATWTCQPANGIDAGCVRSQSCLSRLCVVGDAGASCSTAGVIISPAGCNNYVVDAGGGG